MYYSNHRAHYSPYRGLERAVYAANSNSINISNISYSVEAVPGLESIAGYAPMYSSPAKLYESDYRHNSTPLAEVEAFLRPKRPLVDFVNADSGVRELAEKIFELTAGQKLSEDILIRICTDEELQKIHGRPCPGLMGLSANGNSFSQSLIFVRENHLDKLLVTIGHEIGHVFTHSLRNRHDEEAKAFSFEFAWLRAIKENNVGDMAGCFADLPAKNGLHDVAFGWVVDRLREKKPMELHWSLVHGLASVGKGEDAILISP